MERIYSGMVCAVLAATLAPTADAGTLRVMTIGDSITWGFSYEGPDGVLGTADDQIGSNGGWRSPLSDMLNSDPHLNTVYEFVGTKGDNNPNTVFNEVGRTSQFDGYDGPGNTTALHEGYSGWVIDRTPHAPASLTDGRDGILENLVSHGGSIDPGSADVVMISIGINDILRGTLNTPTATGADAVDRLANLIAEVQSVAGDALIMVSNLLPVEQFKNPFSKTANPTDSWNQLIAEFNDALLARYFGGSWLDDAYGTQAYATSTMFDNVMLLNVASVFNPADPNNYLYNHNNDFLHPTANGYNAMAEFYHGRFIAHSAHAPAPTAVAGVLLLAGLLVKRRRSLAA